MLLLLAWSRRSVQRESFVALDAHYLVAGGTASGTATGRTGRTVTEGACPQAAASRWAVRYVHGAVAGRVAPVEGCCLFKNTSKILHHKPRIKCANCDGNDTANYRDFCIVVALRFPSQFAHVSHRCERLQFREPWPNLHSAMPFGRRCSNFQTIFETPQPLTSCARTHNAGNILHLQTSAHHPAAHRDVPRAAWRHPGPTVRPPR